MSNGVSRVFGLMLPLVASAGCAQILGIEDLNSGTPGTNTDGGFDPGKPVDAPGMGAACAPVPVFGAATNYSVGMGIAVAVGDLNRDGVKDVVVVTLSGDVVIFNGTGNGLLGPSRPLHTTPTLATGALIADVDGDGSSDVVTWDGFYMPTGLMGNNTVSVHRQNPTAAGTFLTAQSFSVFGVLGAVAGKLNADNRADLMIASQTTTGTVP
ncbi:MAG: Repeat domain in Vibrio, Colwellia, Bradyrhizobium and Shewanella, partial [Deltaproteobacteria bacterium]|nr:Repeat domain in Vibrio, Colwellia, Bradyrhizobium and Shewanella [Deltaproteobacteria bacterium]